MRLSSLLCLLAASAVEASVCKPSKPVSSALSSSSSASSASSSPSPYVAPCNTNSLADRITGVSYANIWQYSSIDQLAVSFPATCMNNANDYPDGSCVNLLMRELPTGNGNGPWTAATITRTLATTAGTSYSLRFMYQLGSDEPEANTGSHNYISCTAGNAIHSSGWSPFYMGLPTYPEDTDLGYNFVFSASAAATSMTCVLVVDTPINMTINSFALIAAC
ncbi:hypothetical protein SCUCBS95973_006055 [Sporothrix curviconia]|uniref:Uncharacterized protein n=1 Tax=Sporothrix curviconia TaxID=1260050 RepID=A0ABP0C1Y4_9PEZI